MVSKRSLGFKEDAKGNRYLNENLLGFHSFMAFMFSPHKLNAAHLADWQCESKIAQDMLADMTHVITATPFYPKSRIL